MRVDCDWNGKQNFVANVNGFKIQMDAVKPFGDEKDPTPKRLVLAALCGCTGMDVVGLLKKNKQAPEKFRIEADAAIATNHPHELRDIKLKYLIDASCGPAKVVEAVNLSQTRYCAVSSMVSRGTTISYDVSLNGKKISQGKSDFQGGASQSEQTKGLGS
ncbi:MAG: OsmC family protein [Bdellovibrionales bacterium]